MAGNLEALIAAHMRLRELTNGRREARAINWPWMPPEAMRKDPKYVQAATDGEWHCMMSYNVAIHHRRGVEFRVRSYTQAAVEFESIDAAWAYYIMAYSGTWPS